MSRTPRHGSGSLSPWRIFKAAMSDAASNGDAILLLVVVVGIVLWPVIG